MKPEIGKRSVVINGHKTSISLEDAAAMAFTSDQNASSRLMLVLCPLMTMDRFTIPDFMFQSPPPLMPCAG